MAEHHESDIGQSRRNAGLIIAARFISDFGAFLNMVALSTYVYLLSNSVVNVSIFLACRVAGGLLASLVGTPFFRRFQGRSSLVGFDLLRAALLSLLLVLPPAWQLPLLPVIALGVGVGNAMFAIGLNSQLPYWVEPSLRLTTNAWLTSVAASGAVLGSLVSGLLVAGFGYPVVFMLNVATYLTAALLILPLRMVEKPQPRASQRDRFSEWRQLREGLRGAPMLAGMLIVSMADTLGSAAHNVGFPVLSALISPDSASKTMGLMLALWAVGKFAGARGSGFLLRQGQQRTMERAFFIGVALMSTGFILTFQQTGLAWLLVFVVWAGIGDGVAEVSLISRAQSEPESLRLPIFSLLTLMQMTGFGIGMLLVAPFYVWWTPAAVIVLFHGLPLTMLLVVQVWVYRYGQRCAARRSGEMMNSHYSQKE
ncbi:MFS transporter [Dickeya zeae]|uniref:Major facilitator superfamily MFS_1 n=1 Tax=Dickeya zeae (strain Ech586) TaxID=590409 RepID=D2C0I0_DICZ5|nr:MULTISPECIES: MFS transporter [Dickeya]ACZ74923.1 major facilitator superfamily MFS_1 [Dickeya parazeae Ech586]UCZ77136.1 MFS transporter [Dickeya zeae]